ncbi:30S ribosomal protein S6 [bacterium]|nr:30S ribosomal protein S6 [bacterium]
MPLYESTFITRQEMAPNDVEQLADSMVSIMSEQGGKLIKREYWGLRSMAYRIKKNRKGHYTYLGYEAPAAAVNELERRLRLNEDVVRYMTIRVEKVSAEPTPIMNPGSSDTGRPGRPDARGPYAGRPSRGPRRESTEEVSE